MSVSRHDKYYAFLFPLHLDDYGDETKDDLAGTRASPIFGEERDEKIVISN